MRTFTCEGCKRTFYTTTSPEAIEAEFVANYGHSSDGEDVGSCCDDCHAQIQSFRARPSAGAPK